jgi:UDP-N-acetylglucosamine 2-epimerase (non-hydrolysing)
MKHPYPEEMNRVLTSHLATLHFAPTAQARENLLAEGIDKGKITITGNTVIDALNLTRSRLNGRGDRIAGKFRQIDFRKKMILVTGHRRESFGTGFRNICMALRTIASVNRMCRLCILLTQSSCSAREQILSGIPTSIF